MGTGERQASRRVLNDSVGGTSQQHTRRTVLDSKEFVNKALVGELGKQWCDHVDGSVEDDEGVDLV